MSENNQNDTPPKSFYSRPRFIIAVLLTVSLITLVFLAGIVFMAFSYIRSSIETTSLTIPFLSDEPVKNQIAFIGNDDNLWVVSPAGENLYSITHNGQGYRFPTWSPDGRRLAFIGPDGNNSATLYISPASSSNPVELYKQSQSAPFYLYWAPDSRSITFLTQETSGLAMQQVDVYAPDKTRTLAKGAPFYWVWSPHSDKMLMHVGGSRAASDEAHISIFNPQKDAQPVELELAPGRFQAPLWSSSGDYFFYIATNDEGSESIYKTQSETLEQTVVTNLGGFTYLVLAPNSQYIAYLQLEEGFPPPFGKAYLVDTNGQNHKLLTDDPIASIYWSPDGTKLALLGVRHPNDGSTAQKTQGLAAPLPQAIQLRWWIYDLESETLEPLISFSPTEAFLQTVPYFDQYHLSLTFWSPDSRYFVVTKQNSNSKGGSVWVADTSGQEDPLKIGEGTLAVWSWE